jgi:hypothetical protein
MFIVNNFFPRRGFIRSYRRAQKEGGNPAGAEQVLERSLSRFAHKRIKWYKYSFCEYLYLAYPQKNPLIEELLHIYA